jgi:hypothetical protein
VFGYDAELQQKVKQIGGAANQTFERDAGCLSGGLGGGKVLGLYGYIGVSTSEIGKLSSPVDFLNDIRW